MFPIIRETMYTYTSFEDLNTPIDFTNGRASLIHGRLFYSPNCRRDVDLPLPLDDATRLRHSYREDFRELHRPLWWSPETAYIAFLTMEQTYYGDLYQELFNVPSWIDRDRSGFSLEPRTIISWAKLQRHLEVILQALHTRYHVPEVKKVIYTALGHTGFHKNIKDFRYHIQRTRGWFSVLMAHLSYLIAIALSMDKNSTASDYVPLWFEYLVVIGKWNQAFISSIQASVANFSPHIARVGIFLQILWPEREQFSVDWLCRCSVPVWYPWGQAEVDACKQTARIRRLGPPAYQLQLATTFLSKNPSDKSPMCLPEKRPSQESAEDQPEKPWQEYLKKLHQRTQSLIAKEEPSAQQSRLSREANPPFRKTVVYVWERNIDGKYERTKVPQRCNAETLDEFKQPGQKVYNACFNEWNCGFDFVDQQDYNWDLENWDEDDHDDIYPGANVTATAAASSNVSNSSHEPPLDGVQQVDTAQAFNFQILPCSQILSEFFGFTPPLPLPTSHPSPVPHTDAHVNIFRSVVGIIPSSQFLNSVLSHYCFEFVFAFSQSASSVPRNGLFDLSIGNRMPLDGARRFQRLRRVDANIFLLDLDVKDATVPWRIATTNDINTLLLCRLDSTFDDYKLCIELLRRGVRFHTFLPLQVPGPAEIPTVFIPVRLSGYKFTSGDYKAYLREQEALLRDPRIARAALMRGGIIWRLVVSQVSISEVLHGPTAAVTLHRQGVVVPSTESGICLWDDTLDETELNSLCGLVYCYTGMFYLYNLFIFLTIYQGQGSQRSQKSWWPLEILWSKDVAHTYWNEDAENIFTKRLKSLESSDAQPLTATEWRGWIRSASTARRFHGNASKASESFIRMKNL